MSPMNIRARLFIRQYGWRLAVANEIIRSIDKVFILQRYSKVFYDGKAAFV